MILNDCKHMKIIIKRIKSSKTANNKKHEAQHNKNNKNINKDDKTKQLLMKASRKAKIDKSQKPISKDEVRQKNDNIE